MSLVRVGKGSIEPIRIGWVLLNLLLFKTQTEWLLRSPGASPVYQCLVRVSNKQSL